MALTEAIGRLVIIGGGEDKEGDCRILKKFIQLAGGEKAQIVIMTVATDKPEEVGKEYTTVFKRLGVKTIDVVDVSTRADVAYEKKIKTLEKATGVFFTGGDQLHITSLLGGSEMHKALRQIYKDNVVIAGTSAGAAMMSNSMIVSGDSEENPKQGAVEIGPGMDFIIGSIIDVHFSQRGRHGRLLTAIAHYPQDMGIGIDEDTAIIVNKAEFKVLGSGAVTILDGSEMTYTNLPYVEKNQNLTMVNVKTHVLPEGMKFNMPERKVITPNGNPKK